MYGENQAEYGNKVDENNIPTMNEKFFSIEDPLQMTLGGITMKEIIEKYKYTYNDFAPYIPYNEGALKSKGVEVHYLGYYLRWDPQECYYYASENTGFQANSERTEGSYSKYSSIDDKIDPFHYYTTLIKFGIGRATYDAAQEIRNGKITREEGMKLVQKFDQEFPLKFFKTFLSYIDTTEEEFWTTINKFRSPHLWKQVESNWKLRHTISKDGTDDQ
jgi:hypothetical protein